MLSHRRGVFGYLRSYATARDRYHWASKSEIDAQLAHDWTPISGVDHSLLEESLEKKDAAAQAVEQEMIAERACASLQPLSGQRRRAVLRESLRPVTLHVREARHSTR